MFLSLTETRVGMYRDGPIPKEGYNVYYFDCYHLRVKQASNNTQGLDKIRELNVLWQIENTLTPSIIMKIK